MAAREPFTLPCAARAEPNDRSRSGQGGAAFENAGSADSWATPRKGNRVLCFAMTFSVRRPLWLSHRDLLNISAWRSALREANLGPLPTQKLAKPLALKPTRAHRVRKPGNFSCLERKGVQRSAGSYGRFGHCPRTPKLAWEVATLVGVARFERAAPASRKQCSTRLSYTPTAVPCLLK